MNFKATLHPNGHSSLWYDDLMHIKLVRYQILNYFNIFQTPLNISFYEGVEFRVGPSSHEPFCVGEGAPELPTCPADLLLNPFTVAGSEHAEKGELGYPVCSAKDQG